MEPKPGREATLALRYEIIPTRPDGLTPFLCLDCRRQLDVHQPDADLPDRMLATCEHCKGWHLVEWSTDGKTVVVALLSDLTPLRAAEPARASRRRGAK
jgi:hypothetical protein